MRAAVPAKRAKDESIQLRIPCGLDRVEPAQQVRRCGVTGAHAAWPGSSGRFRDRGPRLRTAEPSRSPDRLSWLPVDTGFGYRV